MRATNHKFSQTKPIVWQLIVALALIVALTSIVGEFEFNREKVRLEENLLLTARSMDHSVSQELLDVQKFTQAYSATLDSEILSRDFSIAREEAVHALTATHIAHHIVLTDGSGQQLFNTLVDYGRPLPITKNIDRIREVFNTAQPRISNFVTGTVSGNHEILVDVPVIQNGAVIYVLTSVLDSNELQRILFDQHFPAEWVASIFDRNGVIVTRTRDAEKYAGQKVSQQLLGQLPIQDSATYESNNLEGTPVLAAFVRSPDTGFGVVIGVPKQLLWEEVAHTLPVTSITISIAVFALLAAWHFEGNLKQKRENEELSRMFINNAPASLALFDREMHYLAVSEQWIEDYSLGDKDIIGVSHYEIFPEINEKWKNAHQRGLAGEKIKNNEDQFVRSDGRIQWIKWEVIPWHTSKGLIGGIIIHSENITERKQTEEALHKSEATYRSLFENMLNGFAYCQMIFKDGKPFDFIYLNVNGAFESLTGLKEVVGRKVSDVIPRIRETDMNLLEIYGRVSMTGKPERFEIWIEALQMWFWISVYRPMQGYFVAVFDVITERKNTEIQLHKLAQVVEQSPESIMITNLQGDLEYVNEAFVRKSGYSREEIIGKNPRILKSGNTPPETFASLWSSLIQGESWSGEFYNRSKQGEVYIEFAIIAPIRHEGRVTHYVSIQEDITAKKQAESRLEQLAHFDLLTGLPNHSLLRDQFKYAMSLAERNSEHIAVMFLDLDHFKNINDTLGHSIGDQLLMKVSKRLKSVVRNEDIVSRMGGDEFIFILSNTDSYGASLVATKLIEAVSAPYQIDHHELIATPSIGIAMYPEDGNDLETLSKNADVAMYRVKQAGRNDFRFYTQSMQANSARNLQLSIALRNALSQNQLHLMYQPQVSMQDGRLIGADALLRWKHPELGLISPAEFIPLAESSGLIIPIGEWVLRTAAMQMKTWLDKKIFPPMLMAVNLSAVQFRHAKLPERISAILNEVGLPPENLELELTEAIAMDDPLTAIAVMDDLYGRGIRMSIDDFGTGYSSLSYLKKFKVYKLKIDQSFVRDISADPDDKAIVTAIINMASSLDMKTIAEGVETAAQLEFLRLHGCDEVQGYYFSKPLVAKEFETYVGQM